jgi:hypothetical protein
MEMRVFGRTGMQLSVLGFGCGAVGGLMVRGDPLDQERAIGLLANRRVHERAREVCAQRPCLIGPSWADQRASI